MSFNCDQKDDFRKNWRRYVLRDGVKNVMINMLKQK